VEDYQNWHKIDLRKIIGSTTLMDVVSIETKNVTNGSLGKNNMSWEIRQKRSRK